MTQLEQRLIGLATTALRKYIADEPDWEQRRYEIAMTCAANGRSIEHSIATADALIKELKKKNEG